MKENLQTVLLAIVMAFLIPALLFSVAGKLISRQQRANEPVQTEPTEAAGSVSPQAELVWVINAEGDAVQMRMDVYLTGVLLGEMPAGFDTEALKAQAVVARTYALRSNMLGKKHSQGGVCMDAACCQAYCESGDYLAKGGTRAAVEKVRDAVIATEAQVLTYQGKLIEATYFSCSGGRTEDAVAVWGTEIPYLQAVDSPGEENAAHYRDSISFSAAEFAKLLGISDKGSPASWLGTATYTDGGGIDTIFIAGRLFRGTELRQKLGLNSTAVEISAAEGTVYIDTRGFGHRVGMSQYGAEAMAVSGNSYDEILKHYYPGTYLETVSHN